MFAKFFKVHTIKVVGDSSLYRPVIRVSQPVRPVNFIARSEPVFALQVRAK